MEPGTDGYSDASRDRSNEDDRRLSAAALFERPPCGRAGRMKRKGWRMTTRNGEHRRVKDWRAGSAAQCSERNSIQSPFCSQSVANSARLISRFSKLVNWSITRDSPRCLASSSIFNFDYNQLQLVKFTVAECWHSVAGFQSLDSNCWIPMVCPFSSVACHSNCCSLASYLLQKNEYFA